MGRGECKTFADVFPPLYKDILDPGHVEFALSPPFFSNRGTRAKFTRNG